MKRGRQDDKHGYEWGRSISASSHFQHPIDANLDNFFSTKEIKMAGKQGMKGGGGARPGAGRKKNPAVTIEVSEQREKDSASWLRAIRDNSNIDVKLRIDAAKALLPYELSKKGEGGKKEERQSAAIKALQGKFATPPPPLRIVRS